MNTYDPADGIVYRHMARSIDPSATPVAATSVVHLPAGYADQSPCTRLPARADRTAAAA